MNSYKVQKSLILYSGWGPNLIWMSFSCIKCVNQWYLWMVWTVHVFWFADSLHVDCIYTVYHYGSDLNSVYYCTIQKLNKNCNSVDLSILYTHLKKLSSGTINQSMGGQHNTYILLVEYYHYLNIFYSALGWVYNWKCLPVSWSTYQFVCPDFQNIIWNILWE